MIPRPASRQQMFRRTAFAFGMVLVLLTFFLVQLTVDDGDTADNEKKVSLKRDEDNKDELRFQDELDEEVEVEEVSTELRNSKVQPEIIWYNLIEENGIGQVDERFECDLGIWIYTNLLL